jgi:hypothetical protein
VEEKGLAAGIEGDAPVALGGARGACVVVIVLYREEYEF